MAIVQVHFHQGDTINLLLRLLKALLSLEIAYAILETTLKVQ